MVYHRDRTKGVQVEKAVLLRIALSTELRAAGIGPAGLEPATHTFDLTTFVCFIRRGTPRVISKSSSYKLQKQPIWACHYVGT
jgi:hypothetical protein